MREDVFSRLKKLDSPVVFFRIAASATPWFKWPTFVLTAAGLVGGLVSAPSGNRLGEGLRIAYVHLSSVWLSLGVFAVMAMAGAIGLVCRLRSAYVVAAAAAPIGAGFTLFALVSGSLWTKWVWGAYWVWNAGIASELALLFLYAGYIALVGAFADRLSGDRAGAVLAVLGAINVPIIHYAVQWQAPTRPGIDFYPTGFPVTASAVWPLPVLAAGFVLYFGWLMSLRLRIEILHRYRGGGMAGRVFE